MKRILFLLLLTLYISAIEGCGSNKELANICHNKNDLEGKVPDSCLIDTLGIRGAIFPDNYKFISHYDTSGPFSIWTPSKNDILKAEAILMKCSSEFPCIQQNLKYYVRQYAGKEMGDIFIQGIAVPKGFPCGYRNFWITIYDGGCNVFEATINVKKGTCDIYINGQA